MECHLQTGEIPGVNLYDLLDGKDVKYSAEINTQASPLLNFPLTWIPPLILFVGIGQLMGRSLMKRMGGGTGKRNDVWQVECEDLCRIRDRYHICGCGRRGRGEGCVKKEIVDFLHKLKILGDRCGAAVKGAPVSRTSRNW